MRGKGCCAWRSSTKDEPAPTALVGIPPIPGDAIAVRAFVEHQRGRWVVYLEITMVPDREDYLVTHRIADYSTRSDADVAARWMVRAAGRDIPRPPLGF